MVDEPIVCIYTAFEPIDLHARFGMDEVTRLIRDSLNLMLDEAQERGLIPWELTTGMVDDLFIMKIPIPTDEEDESEI